MEALKQRWREEQDALRARLVEEDDAGSPLDPRREGNGLRLVGGVDVSFFGEGDEERACAALVVLSFPALEVLYEDYEVVRLEHPYIPGFLAFREAPHLAACFERLRRDRPELVPQVVLVDGNGVLHHRGFGVASHLGVLCGVPAVGVAKTLLCVDGLDREAVEEACRQRLLARGDTLDVVGASGRVWGRAVRGGEKATNWVYVSAGHRVSLDTAVAVVLATCRHKIPEPVRAADLGSRDAVRRFRAAEQQ